MNSAILSICWGEIVIMANHDVQLPADRNLQVAQAVAIAQPLPLPGGGLHESHKSPLIQVAVKTTQEKKSP